MVDLSTAFLSETVDSSGGTFRWMAPELLDPPRFGADGRPTRESDCYALGMVIYEVGGYILDDGPSFTQLRFLLVSDRSIDCTPSNPCPPC